MDIVLYMDLGVEEKLWCYGRVLIGVDEAGRGPLAGPVVASAVLILPKRNFQFSISNFEFRNSALRNDFDDLLKLSVNDSKKLSPKKREEIFERLINHPAALWAVGEASEREIDELNILQASLLAMRRAVETLFPKLCGIGFPAVVYVDGREVVPDLIVDQKAVIGGDAKVFSIAAASIIAKVTRDRKMMELDKRYPRYGFHKHKGYGTKVHFEALRRHGLCPVHRKSFLKAKSV